MKLEIKERGSREFYDEFLYVVFHHKKVRKKPTKKVHSLFKEAIRYIVISLFLFLLTAYLYFSDSTGFFLFGFCFCGFVFGLSLFYLWLVQNYLHKLMKGTEVFTVEVHSKGISLETDHTKFSLDYSEIEMILIEQYAICILPKDFKRPLMSISVQYKEKFLEAIKKYHQEEMIIDNSSLY